MESPKNSIHRSYRFPDRTPEELGDSPDMEDAFLLEAKWYDGAGNLVRKEDYDADGNVNESDVFVFNERGLITGHQHSLAGELTEDTSIVYNESGRPLTETKVYAEGGKQITEYTYNAEGNLLRKSIRDEEGTEEGYELQTWENGNLITREVRDILMESGEDFSFSYSKEGNEWILTEEIQREIPSGVVYRTVYSTGGYITYDGKGSRFASHRKVQNEQGKITESHYSTMQKNVSSYFSYNESGQLIEEKRKTGEHENYRARFFYGGNGELVMAHVTEASSGTFTDVSRTIPLDQES
ncbi:MAG: hypothetical protein IT233_13250 [Bacteroidia bacterium]|nr:hypothetical protein [Bacteroidia bacterium]